MATKVRAGCVQAVLRAKTRAGEDAESVARVAARAARSPRTIYRVMGYPSEKLIQLDLADRLLIAADGMLAINCSDCGDIVENG